jgi:nucleotide-binding universal stress UspA family protein
MYKRILLPTDGSALARDAIVSGIRLARDNGAAVIGLYVVPMPHPDLMDAWMHHDPHYPAHQQALFDKFADDYLCFVAESALTEKVPCECRKVASEHPYQAIVDTARETGCELIFMASHGWHGDMAQCLGSETLKVLLHSPLPVLVHKSAATGIGTGAT